MKKVIIYGSCVTIDIFRFYPKDIEIVDYFARSCMFSLNSQPLDFKIEEINLESEFQKRLVIRDFTKEFFTTIKEKPFDYLLIDLLEELSDVLSTNDTIITKSNELINSGFLKLHPEFKEIKRHSSDITLWEEECKSFIHKITNVVNPNKIILVKAMLAKKYYI
jgi:hypothetical protein